MSFVRRECGTLERQTYNPEDVSDAKPRVIKLKMVKMNKKGFSKCKEEELEIDRELTHFTNIEGFQEKDPDKHMMLNMLGDLSSETMVLLGNTKLDEKLVEEELKKNLEWENWKKDRNIKEWKPKRGKSLPVTKYPAEKLKTKLPRISSKGCQSKGKMNPLSPRKSNVNIMT